jgi:IS1 family transposase
MKIKEIKHPHVIDYEALTYMKDDPAVMTNFARGNCNGIFQFEREYAQDILRSMDDPKKPMTIDDISAVSALIRPGPLGMGMQKVYAERRTGRQKVEYIHPVMQQFTEKTYGVIVYQEQIMQIIAWFLGRKKDDFDKLIAKENWKEAVIPDLIEGDNFRKYVKKFDADSMKKYEDKFIKAAVDKKIPLDISKEIFKLIFQFSSYGFNLCLGGENKIETTLNREYTLKNLYDHKKELFNIIIETENGKYIMDAWEEILVERDDKEIKIKAKDIQEKDLLIVPTTVSTRHDGL